MKRIGLSAVLLFIVFGCTSVLATDRTFTVTADKPDGIYNPGETMTFSILYLEDKKPVAGKELRWVRKGDDQKEEKGSITSQETPVTLTTSLDKPGFVYLTVTATDENGHAYVNNKAKPIRAECGAGVQPDQLQGAAEPDDFDAFWARQKAALAAVPLKFTMEPAPVKNEALVGFDVKVDCAGGRPVSGYLAKPKDAAEKSLPARVSFHGYGVRSANMPESNAKMGFLAFDINAHGIDNGKDDEFYKSLSDGELKSYGFKGNENPENSYFLGMFLRVMRALEFVKAQPEWDGKNLVVNGGSQGGTQALAAAGLDSQVTLCFVNKPWCCDLGGITLGRLKGWRPDYVEGIRYFDAANHAKRIKCHTLLDAGLGDYVCPPSSVTVAYNNITASKKILYIQGANHGYNPPGSPNLWRAFNEAMAPMLKKPAAK